MKINWKELENEIITHNGKMNLIEVIERWATNEHDKLAVHFEDENGKVSEYSYIQLIEETNKFANLLGVLGIKNSQVAVFLPKCPEIYIAILGIIKSGNTAVPLFEAFQEQGLELRLGRADVSAVVTNKELFERVEKIKSRVKTLKETLIIDSGDYKEKISKQKKDFRAVLKDKDETCLMMFTSSTAGTPVAGIEIPHYGAVQWIYTAKEVLNLNKESKYFCSAHPGWVTGSIYGVLAPFLIGSSVYSIAGRFNSKKWIEFLKKNKISHIYTAPTALKMLKQDIKKEDLKSVKNLYSVGEALPESLVEFYKNLGVYIIDTYWQTETGAIIIANTGKKPGSMGQAIGVNIAINNNMIIIEKPWPSMMTGIYKHEKMYKDYFSGKWFKTNDMAEKKGDNFYFIGRKDDIIKTAGERVSPLEIENILLKHHAVKEAAVIGIPDEIKGSIIKAFIVLNRDFKESEKLKEEISQFVKQHYAGHSYPKQIEFAKELPKNNAGKILRKGLKES